MREGPVINIEAYCHFCSQILTRLSELRFVNTGNKKTLLCCARCFKNLPAEFKPHGQRAR